MRRLWRFGTSAGGLGVRRYGSRLSDVQRHRTRQHGWSGGAVTELERALDNLEASLASVWAQADAEYIARRYPWHEPGVGCDRYDDHVHGKSGRIYYWPEQITVLPPDETP
jgi:hypothetical protein